MTGTQHSLWLHCLIILWVIDNCIGVTKHTKISTNCQQFCVDVWRYTSNTVITTVFNDTQLVKPCCIDMNIEPFWILPCEGLMKGTLVVFSYVPVRVSVPCDQSRPLEEGGSPWHFWPHMLSLMCSDLEMHGGWKWERGGKGYQSPETTVMIVTQSSILYPGNLNSMHARYRQGRGWHLINVLLLFLPFFLGIVIEFAVRMFTILLHPSLKAIFYHSTLILILSIIIGRQVV